MPIKKAVKAYVVDKLNCAQSVLHGFQETHEVEDREIAEAKRLGGGRAEKGVCGALHAAMVLAGDKGEDVAQQFEQKAGARDCKSIRQIKKVSCKECVELAAKILNDTESI